MGVPRDELYLVGQLLGIKTIQNEFVAFGSLTTSPEFANLFQRANLIATYGICGFANIGSVALYWEFMDSSLPREEKILLEMLYLLVFVVL